MARPHRIWYRSARKAWYVEIGEEQIKLLKGPNDGETRKLAEQEFYKLMAERSVQPPLDIGPSRLTVAALIDGYLDMNKDNLSTRVWTERRRMLEKFYQFLNDRQVLLVKDCLPLHLLQFIQAHPTWKSDDTKADVVKTIKVTFNWGHEMKIAPPNPFTGKSLRGFTFRNSRRPMTEEEFRKLIEACGEKRQLLKAILQFCYETGARPCEAREARWQDLNLDQATITLDQHKTSKTQKVKKPRVIHLTNAVVVLLRDLYRQRPGAEFLFTNRRGRPYHRNSIQQNLRRLRRKIGLPEDVKLYGARHGFGTRAVLNKVGLAELAELMGHEKGSRITAHYVHIADQHEHLKDALRQINRPSSGECA